MKAKVLPIIKKFLVFCIVFAVVFGVKEYREANKISDELASSARVSSSQVADAVTIVKDKSATCTAEGITVTVKEAVNDEHRVVALLEVRADSKDVVFDSDCTFDFGNFVTTYSFSSEDGKSFNLIVDIRSFDEIDDENIGIILTDLVKIKDREIVKKGVWKVSFKPVDGDITKSMERDENDFSWELPSSYYEGKEYLELRDVEIKVSPMSVYLKGEYDASVDDSAFQDAKIEYSILTADGNNITGTFSQRAFKQDDGKKEIKLFDVQEAKIESEIKSIIINGMEVPLDK